MSRIKCPYFVALFLCFYSIQEGLSLDSTSSMCPEKFPIFVKWVFLMFDKMATPKQTYFEIR